MKAVSGKEMCRILERKGWMLLQVRGSHYKYSYGQVRIVVPVHGNQSLKPELQRAIMKQAGITESDP